jgi:hypothetical protein
VRTRAQTARDAALRRLTRLNVGITAAAVIATGALTEAVAHGFRGRSVTRAPAETVPAGSGAATASPARHHRAKRTRPHHQAPASHDSSTSTSTGLAPAPAPQATTPAPPSTTPAQPTTPASSPQPAPAPAPAPASDPATVSGGS